MNHVRPPYFPAGEIQSICLGALKDAKLLPDRPGPVRIDRLIETAFGLVPDYEELPDGVLGLSQFVDGRVVRIVVSRALDRTGTRVSDRRVRTTLAHEAGHVLLHSNLFRADSESAPLLGDWSETRAPRVLCRNIGPSRQGAQPPVWYEYQANQAIAGLLLPRPLVETVVSQFVGDTASGFPRMTPANARQAARALSDVFDVNPVVAEIHLQTLFPRHGTGQLALDTD